MLAPGASGSSQHLVEDAGPAQSARYGGPLFSVHEHVGSRDVGRTVAEDTEFFAAAMDEAGVARIVPFVPTRFGNRPGPGEEQIKAAAQTYPGRFVPFWATIAGDFLGAPEGLRRVFAEGPFWAGSGEWPLWQQYRYRADQQFTPPDDPVLLQVYDVVAEFDRTVMVHPHYGRPALERALSHNRKTPFLVHGTQAATRRPPCLPAPSPLGCMDASLLTELMTAHPNFFYDVSVTANPHTFDDTVGGAPVTVHFREDLDAHVEEAYAFYGGPFEAFPDRFLWGIDTGNQRSNYEPEFFRLQIEFYRRLLGRLPPTTAEKIAYRNAERIVLRIPTPENPPAGAQLPRPETSLSWINPPNTTQYHLQMIPANDDGPGVNVVRNPESSLTLSQPVLGQGPYVLLPDMTYRWSVRTASASTPLGDDSPVWRPWSETRTFRTPVRDSSRIRPVAPTAGSVTSSASQTLQWSNEDADVFYYEVQASPDGKFGEEGPQAPVWHNLVHGGVSSPLNSWTTPELQQGTIYYWRVRPRVQGDGTPVGWSAAWNFRVP